MTENEVVELMKSSKSAKEWDDNCDIVKERCNGYPDFWFRAIIRSGLAKETMAQYGGSPDITITTF